MAGLTNEDTKAPKAWLVSKAAADVSSAVSILMA
jgi:hypothetical protein